MFLGTELLHEILIDNNNLIQWLYLITIIIN